MLRGAFSASRTLELENIVKWLVKLIQKIIRFVENDENAWAIAPYLPCTTMNNIWRALGREKGTVLDVGGGRGTPMRFLNRKRRFRFTVNADANWRRLKEAKEKGTHDEYILCDVRSLPFKRKSFDIVLCIEIIEHIEMEGGFSLLSAVKEIAHRRIVLSTDVNTPIKPVPERRIGRDIDHVSSWPSSEFKRLGYKVRGSSFPRLIGGWRPFYFPAKSYNPLIILHRILDVVTGPFVYFLPSRAGHQVAVKYLDKS